MKIKEDLTDEKFIVLMELANTSIGRGSYYGTRNLSRFGIDQRDYKDALEDYNLIIEKDRISGAYARYFSDYMGIALAFIPVILATGVWMTDKRSKSQDILYVRERKSRDIVWSRYLAMLTCMSLVILVIATFYNIDIIRRYGMSNIDVLAYYKYTIIWLIPTLMISLATGTLPLCVRMVVVG